MINDIDTICGAINSATERINDAGLLPCGVDELYMFLMGHRHSPPGNFIMSAVMFATGEHYKLAANIYELLAQVINNVVALIGSLSTKFEQCLNRLLYLACEAFMLPEGRKDLTDVAFAELNIVVDRVASEATDICFQIASQHDVPLYMFEAAAELSVALGQATVTKTDDLAASFEAGMHID